MEVLMKGGTEGNINCGPGVELGRQFREDTEYKTKAGLQQDGEWQKLARRWRVCGSQGSEGWGEAVAGDLWL